MFIIDISRLLRHLQVKSSEMCIICMFQINIKAFVHYFHPFKSVYASIVIISCIAQYKIALGLYIPEKPFLKSFSCCDMEGNGL